MISPAYNFCQWLQLKIHYKRDVYETANKVSYDQIFDLWRFYVCKTFLEQRKTMSQSVSNMTANI